MTMKVRRGLPTLLVGLLMLLPQACADNSMAPNTSLQVPTLQPPSHATIGSRLNGVMEETTTSCMKTGECTTTTSSKNVSYRVGNARNDLHLVQSLAFVRQAARDTAFTKNGTEFTVRAHKLTAIGVRNGKRWEVHFTADSAEQHIIDYEIYENGVLNFKIQNSWGSIGGVWYKNKSETKWRVDGVDFITKQRTFKPKSISPAAALGTGNIDFFSGGVSADASCPDPDVPCIPITIFDQYYGGRVDQGLMAMALEGLNWANLWARRLADLGGYMMPHRGRTGRESGCTGN